MYSQSLFITALLYESSKREAINRGIVACERTAARLLAFADEYDKRHRKTQKCSGDILCESEGVRHRKDCLGKTEPIAVFWRKVQTNG